MIDESKSGKRLVTTRNSFVDPPTPAQLSRVFDRRGQSSAGLTGWARYAVEGKVSTERLAKMFKKLELTVIRARG